MFQAIFTLAAADIRPLCGESPGGEGLGHQEEKETDAMQRRSMLDLQDLMFKGGQHLVHLGTVRNGPMESVTTPRSWSVSND